MYTQQAGHIGRELDIIEESITALGHLYGEIKGAQAAHRLNDGHYVNKKMQGGQNVQRLPRGGLIELGTASANTDNGVFSSKREISNSRPSFYRGRHF